MTKQYVDKELLNVIALALKSVRARQNVTLEVFYFDTGIHLARIEKGETNITVSTLSQICHYFNISLKDFFEVVEQLQNLNQP
ncbi:helix-turn-helix transcriptional regulator [Flavobacterium sp. FBOR7N2.3]|uniref:Helix-turn-helix transcriptional regulator n=1 Tax=Flavobacterium magnesitis TaxID=3138077 RepID=A0ABV4TGL7_9FLAO